MSVRYQEFLIPEPPHSRLRPSRAQLQKILRYLSDKSWIRDEANADAGDVYLHPSQVNQAIAATSPDDCLVLYLAGGPPGPYPYEWPEDAPEFTPEFCEDVTIIDGPDVLVVPAGMLDLTLPCPHCSADLLPALQVMPDLEEGENQEHIALDGFYRIPANCPMCGEALPLERMALCGADDDEPLDDAPFFCFGIALLAVHTPALETAPPGDLLRALGEICGVPFRSIGRNV